MEVVDELVMLRCTNVSIVYILLGLQYVSISPGESSPHRLIKRWKKEMLQLIEDALQLGASSAYQAFRRPYYLVDT